MTGLGTGDLTLFNNKKVHRILELIDVVDAVGFFRVTILASWNMSPIPIPCHSYGCISTYNWSVHSGFKGLEGHLAPFVSG